MSPLLYKKPFHQTGLLKCNVIELETLKLANVSLCLKITEKVAFNIASEASYAYIQSGQKFIKNGRVWQVFEKLKPTVKQCYQTGKK